MGACLKSTYFAVDAARHLISQRSSSLPRKRSERTGFEESRFPPTCGDPGRTKGERRQTRKMTKYYFCSVFFS